MDNHNWRESALLKGAFILNGRVTVMCPNRDGRWFGYVDEGAVLGPFPTLEEAKRAVEVRLKSVSI